MCEDVLYLRDIDADVCILSLFIFFDSGMLIRGKVVFYCSFNMFRLESGRLLCIP